MNDEIKKKMKEMYNLCKKHKVGIYCQARQANKEVKGTGELTASAYMPDGAHIYIPLAALQIMANLLEKENRSDEEDALVAPFIQMACQSLDDTTFPLGERNE